MPAQWSSTEGTDGGRRLSVTGELDFADEPGLVEAIDAEIASGATVLELDLSELAFIDSSGVRALVRARNAHGSKVRLGELSAPVRRVLEIAGLIGLFDELDEVGGPHGDAGNGAAADSPSHPHAGGTR